MKLTLAQTATFVSLWRRWGLDDDDLAALKRQLMDNPLAGKVMRYTGGIRKTRFAPPSSGSGKSGGYRICYLYFPSFETVFLVLLFPKNQQANLTDDQKKLCRFLARQVYDSLNR